MSFDVKFECFGIKKMHLLLLIIWFGSGWQRSTKKIECMVRFGLWVPCTGHCSSGLVRIKVYGPIPNRPPVGYPTMFPP